MSLRLNGLALVIGCAVILAVFSPTSSAGVGDPCVDDVDCLDTLFCNGEEACVDLICQPGDPPDCADSVPCTIDDCDDENAECTHTPDDGSCVNPPACDGDEWCDPLAGCQPGTPVNCSHLDNQCNEGLCVEPSGSCVSEPSREGLGCDDSQFCNTGEICQGGSCIGGGPRNCSDGAACTSDGCDEGGNQCTHTPVICSHLDDQCNDGVCREPSGSCAREPIREDLTCNDGQYCTEGEVCQSGNCGGGDPLDCSDGVICTSDRCDEGADSCASVTIPDCLDCTGDGVPDVDCTPTDAVGANWTDNIWELGAGNYPDNVNSVAGLSVGLLSPADVTLDTDAAIVGMYVRVGATLRVTGGSLTIKPEGSGRILNKGTITIANNRSINVPAGSFVIDQGGRYLADPDVGGLATGTLAAADITLLPTDCGASDQLTIRDSMVVTTTGDFVLDGTEFAPCFATANGSISRGGKTPPIFQVRPYTAAAAEAQATAEPAGVTSQLNVAGSFRILRAATVCIGCGSCDAIAPVIVVHGSFDNRSEMPSFFRWPLGRLIFPASASIHVFEVAGLDLGSTRDGFSTSASTLFDTGHHTNFSVGRIEVQDGSHVRFENAVTNTAGTSPGDEALYVQELALESGSSITIDGCTVFYCSLEEDGATIDFLNGGALEAAPCPPCGIPTLSSWGLIAMSGLLLAVGAIVCTKRLRPQPSERAPV